MSAWLLIATGFALALLACRQASRGRLSSGHGVVWFAVGVLLFLAGVLLASGLLGDGDAGGGARAGDPAGPVRALIGVLTGACVLLFALGFAHAAALARIDERVKRLAQEVALLNAAQGVPPAMAADEERARDAPAAD